MHVSQTHESRSEKGMLLLFSGGSMKGSHAADLPERQTSEPGKCGSPFHTIMYQRRQRELMSISRWTLVLQLLRILLF